METEKQLRVKMFGPGLSATSGISAVVNNWIAASLAQKTDLKYISTLDEYVPGQFFRKTLNAIRAYAICIGLSQKTTDLVHIHVSSGMSFYRKLVVLLLCRLKGLPTCVHLHGSEFQQFYDDGSFLRRQLISKMFSLTTLAISLSQSWSTFILRVAPRANVEILYNSAPIELYTEESPRHDHVRFLFMGRLGERKGTADLVNAFSKIVSANSNVSLKLGGDGDVQKFRRLADEKGLTNFVDIPGWLSGDDKVRAFIDCDVYVLPSYNEGLPGSILEAMAAGKPVISTPVGGIAEAVHHGVNGFLVAPGDVDDLSEKMSALAKDADLRCKMGMASRTIVEERFESKNIVDRLIYLYSTIA